MGEYTPDARKAYEQLLRNRDAHNIRVINDSTGLSVSYDLDGAEEILSIE